MHLEYPYNILHIFLRNILILWDTPVFDFSFQKMKAHSTSPNLFHTIQYNSLAMLIVVQDATWLENSAKSINLISMPEVGKNNRTK